MPVITRHGWEPMGVPLLVTRAEGIEIMELAGKPAGIAYEEQLGLEPGSLTVDNFWDTSIMHPFGGPSVRRHLDYPGGQKEDRAQLADHPGMRSPGWERCPGHGEFQDRAHGRGQRGDGRGASCPARCRSRPEFQLRGQGRALWRQHPGGGPTPAEYFRKHHHVRFLLLWRVRQGQRAFSGLTTPLLRQSPCDRAHS